MAELEPGLSPYLPDGFADFWQSTVGEALSAPLDFTLRAQREQSSSTHDIEVLEFRGIDGTPRFGWVALPFHSEPHAPGFVWLPPYSRWSMLPSEYGTREGFASASLNFFGESSFHQETYTPSRGYFGEGALSPETWIFRRMFQDAVLLRRILAELPGVDAERLASCGMSQGGGMSIWLGAWDPGIKCVVADEPFLGGMPWSLSGRNYRYPIKELMDLAASSPENDEAVRRTVSFYDTMNQATACRVPTRVVLGLKDPAVKPPQVYAVHQALAGEKELEELDWGHDWHPRMIEGGNEWMRKHLA
ncbi:MAG: acetylxylan esterase [Armatimonadetes bacterium]|nr:acetylxylan esterase [Armatimonadota bacterium]